MIIDNTNPNYRIIKNFLNDQEFTQIKKDLENQSDEHWNYEFDTYYPKQEEVTADYWTGIKDWRGMSINLSKDRKELLEKNNINVELYQNILDLAQKQIEARFEVKVVNEQYLLNRWRVGREQRPHVDYVLDEEDNNYDNMHQFGMTDEYIDLFKKNYKTKHFSTMIYLNSDFEGGELYFPHYENLHIKPEENMMICFKGDSNHMHGVEKVTNGTRYTLSLFWTEI